MNKGTVRLDTKRHAIVLGGKTTRLQEKAWQVAKMLADNHPETVDRSRIVDKIWNGNTLVGEKGLNQAIWQLRRALDDNAQEPRVIRTIPRVGYQWLLPPSNLIIAPFRTLLVNKTARLATLAGVFTVALIAFFLAHGTESPAPIGTASNPATDAYLVDRDIHLVFKDGTIGKLINENHLDIQPPILSSDGSKVAVAVQEHGRCRMVTIDLATLEREDFGDCPVA